MLRYVLGIYAEGKRAKKMKRAGRVRGVLEKLYPGKILSKTRAQGVGVVAVLYPVRLREPWIAWLWLAGFREKLAEEEVDLEKIVEAGREEEARLEKNAAKILGGRMASWAVSVLRPRLALGKTLFSSIDTMYEYFMELEDSYAAATKIRVGVAKPATPLQALLASLKLFVIRSPDPKRVVTAIRELLRHGIIPVDYSDNYVVVGYTWVEKQGRRLIWPSVFNIDPAKVLRDVADPDMSIEAVENIAWRPRKKGWGWEPV